MAGRAALTEGRSVWRPLDWEMRLSSDARCPLSGRRDWVSGLDWTGLGPVTDCADASLSSLSVAVSRSSVVSSAAAASAVCRLPGASSVRLSLSVCLSVCCLRILCWRTVLCLLAPGGLSAACAAIYREVFQLDVVSFTQ